MFFLYEVFFWLKYSVSQTLLIFFWKKLLIFEG